jgi:hypothetical protein
MDLVPLKKHSLTRAQFEQLADVPPEEEWLANITNLKTRRTYKEDVREFIAFTALQDYMGLRSVGRSHIIAGARTWKDAVWRRQPFGASSRRCPRSSITSANAMLSPAIRWTR